MVRAMVGVVMAVALCGVVIPAPRAHAASMMQVPQTAPAVSIAVEPLGVWRGDLAATYLDRPDLARLVRTLGTVVLRARGVAVGAGSEPVVVSVGSTIPDGGSLSGLGRWHETVVAVVAYRGRVIGVAGAPVVWRATYPAVTRVGAELWIEARGLAEQGAVRAVLLPRLRGAVAAAVRGERPFGISRR